MRDKRAKKSTEETNGKGEPLRGISRGILMLKKSKSCIAFLLAVILVFTSLPMSSIALDSEKEEDSGTVSENTENIVDTTTERQESIEEAAIGEIVEITSLREENVKHFRLPNGSYQAIVYSNAVILTVMNV